MPNRHTALPDSFGGLYRRLEEIILGNSGVDEFEEILKLLVLKLWTDTKARLHGPISSIDGANDTLKEANHAWPGVLESTSLLLSDNQYQKCSEALEAFSFVIDNYELIDAVFEYVTNKRSKGDKGQFFTPRYVIDFCVQCLHVDQLRHIADPAAGSGAFLYQSALYSRPQCTDYWGFDFDETTVRIARLLHYVSEVPNYHLFNVNSLLLPQSQVTEQSGNSLTNMTTIEDCLRCNAGPRNFDGILTNPPFAGEVSDRSILDFYDLAGKTSHVERDILFIERCINLLAPNGRMAIVLPDNIFGRKSNAYIREWILRKARVIGVVGLPRSTFQPHTSVKTSVLFLQKRAAVRKNDEPIFFAISEKSGKDSRGNYRVTTSNDGQEVIDHDLDEIVIRFESFRKKEGLNW